eukprot:scaffold17.g598.t1
MSVALFHSLLPACKAAQSFDDVVKLAALANQLQQACGGASASDLQPLLLSSDAHHTEEELEVAAAAAVALIEAEAEAGGSASVSGSATAALERSTTALLLPLLAVAPPARAAQVQQRLAQLVRQTGSWQLAVQLVAACCSATPQTAASAVDILPPERRIALAAELVRLAVEESDRLAQQMQQMQQTQQPEPSSQIPNFRALLTQAAGSTSSAALHLLAGAQEPAALRRAAGRVLLPACLQAAERSGCLGPCLHQLWAACKQMMGDEAVAERRVGLALLVQFSSALLEGRDGGSRGSAHDSIAADPALWALLQRALLDEDSLTCKRAVHVLRAAVTSGSAADDRSAAEAAGHDSRQHWRSFFQLWDALEEFSIHLIREAMPEFDSLHPRAAEGSAAASACQAPMAWQWMEVLWVKGLTHSNLQARRLTALNFLRREWQAPYLRTVPTAFVCGCLAPALGQPHMQPWKPDGESGCVLAALATAFMRRYCGALVSLQQRELLEGLLWPLAAHGNRTQVLVQLTLELAAATDDTAVLVDVFRAEVAGHGAIAGDQEQWGLRLLALLQQVSHVQRSAGSNGSMYALQVHRSLLQVATASVCISTQQLLLSAGCWLQALPLPLLQPHGVLQQAAAEWVAPASAASLAALVQSYLDSGSSIGDGSSAPPTTAAAGGTQAPVSGAEIKVWQVQAAGLARLFLLQQPAQQQQQQPGTAEPEHLVEGALAPLAASLSGVYRRAHQPRGAVLLSLLLLHELLLAVEPVPVWQQQQHQQQGDEEEGEEDGAASPLCGALLGLLAGGSVVEELCSYTSLATTSVFFSGGDAVGGGGAELPALARLALACACGALSLLVRHPQRQEGTWHAVQHTTATLAGFLDAFCHASTVALAQLSPELAGTALGLVSDASRALAAAAEHAAAAATQQAHGQHTALGNPDVNVGAVLQAVLLHHAAAADALAAAKGAGAAAKSMAARWMRLSWYAAAGLLQLAEARQGVGALAPELQAQVLSAALEGVQATGKMDAHSLKPQLHCMRSLLSALLTSAAAEHPQGRGSPPLRQPELSAPVGANGAGAGLDAVLRHAYQAALKGLHNAGNHRRGSITATLVSTCLPPALFAATADDPRLELHAPDGPVQWLLCQLLELGTRSQRLAALFTLQLCSLLATHPAAGPHYCCAPADGGPSLIQQLALFGYQNDTLPPGAPGIEAAWDPEQAAELAAIVAPTNPELAGLFAATELAPRVALVCMLAEWVRAAQQGDAAAAAAGVAAWEVLLRHATEDEEQCSSKYLPSGSTHRKKVRVWQALCVLSPLLRPEQAEAALGPLLGALATANAPSVRQYQEAVAVQLVVLQPRLLHERLLPRLSDYRSTADCALASLELVAGHAVLRLQPSCHPLRPHGRQQERQAPGSRQQQQQDDGQQQEQQHAHREQCAWCCEWEALLCNTALAIVPFSLSHPHPTRSFSQIVLARLCELWPSLLLTDGTMHALTNEDLARLRTASGAGGILTDYSLEEATSPAGVFCTVQAAGMGRQSLLGVQLLGRAEETVVTLEGAPEPLLGVISAHLMGERHKLRRRMAAALADSTQADAARRTAEQRQQERQEGNGQRQAPGPEVAARGAAVLHGRGRQRGAAGGNWQRKITPLDRSLAVADPWAAALELPELNVANGRSAGSTQWDDIKCPAAAGASSEALQAGTGAGVRQELLVVASLITKVPNLAGLARTCEVFRASGLVLSDLAVTRDPGFVSISVTAEQWIPLMEVPEPALAAWLASKAAEGYTLVGLEQTAESESLPSYRFPAKTVLLLGREKEGIPAELLGLLHSTVEIPQLGLIRSLNVHVSGALAIYEYTRQRQGLA